jgi:hypothetical protein
LTAKLDANNDPAMNRTDSWLLPPIAWLLLFLFLYITLWFLYPHEFIASDPWAYSLRAFEISDDFKFGDNHVFSHRIGVTLPIALLYTIFGVNIITTNLWLLCAALLIVVVVWSALPDKTSKIIGAALCITSVPLFTASVALYPDIIATAFMASSTLVLFRRKTVIEAPVRAWLLTPISAIFMLFMAFLAKESAYWVLPLWALAFIADVREGKRTMLLRRFYLPVFIIGVLLGIGYLIFCHVTWGSALARLKSIQALTGQHLWSWDRASSWQLIKRLTISPVRLLQSYYGAPILILALLALALRWPSRLVLTFSIRQPAQLKETGEQQEQERALTRSWGCYTVVCLLFFWFGSTSLTRYEPMPLMERMTLPLLPGLYVLAALMAARLFVNSERAGRYNSLILILLVLGVGGVPFARYVSSWRGQKLAEANAMAIVQQETTKHSETEHLLVCSDVRSPASLAFYFSYKYPANLRALSVGTLSDELLRSAGRRFVFVHKQRSTFLKSSYGHPSYDAEIDALGLAPVYESGDVKLFISEREDELRRLIRSDNRRESGKE